MEYRKGLTLSAETPYWFVQLGELGYPFPTEPAAYRFAARHKLRDPDRQIVVRSPEGVETIIKTTETDPDFCWEESEDT